MSNKCPCKKKNSLPTIRCVRCEQWWHARCVSLKGLSVEELEKLASWHCPLCYELPDTIPQGKLEALIRAEFNDLKTQVKSVETAVNGNKVKALMSEVVKMHMNEQVESVTEIVSANSNNTRRAITESIQQNNIKVVSEVVKSSKAQMDSDAIEREKRKCNLVIQNVSEPDGNTPNQRRQGDVDFAAKCLDIESNQVIRVFRPGKPIRENDRRTCRPLIITVANPELAASLHDYGRGWRREDDAGNVYWVNPDLIKSDRDANLKARLLAKERRRAGPPASSGPQLERQAHSRHSASPGSQRHSASPGSHRHSASPRSRRRSRTQESIASNSSQVSHSSASQVNQAVFD